MPLFILPLLLLTYFHCFLLLIKVISNNLDFFYSFSLFILSNIPPIYITPIFPYLFSHYYYLHTLTSIPHKVILNNLDFFTLSQTLSWLISPYLFYHYFYLHTMVSMVHKVISNNFDSSLSFSVFISSNFPPIYFTTITTKIHCFLTLIFLTLSQYLS